MLRRLAGSFSCIRSSAVLLQPKFKGMSSSVTREDLAKLSHDELVERCLALQAQVAPSLPAQDPSEHGRTVVGEKRRRESSEKGDGNGESQPKKKKKKQRDFDWEAQNMRHVALRVAYFGWNYYGLAAQNDVEETIEHHLFDALVKLRLVKDRASAQYTRAGRTDKGVSALGQVVGLTLRSSQTSGVGVIPAEAPTKKTPKGDQEEYNYTRMLNKVLPADIRVLGWCPVDARFNARFSALSRTYRYFFARGDLDVEKMRAAAKKFIGSHDFRNFCKMDAVNVANFVRVVLSADIVHVDTLSSTEPHGDFYCFKLSGYAFLWHQVRNMMAILFMVGSGKEPVEIVDTLLDLEATPRKPTYEMAPDDALVLHDVGYEELPIIYDPESHMALLGHLKAMLHRKLVAAHVVNNAIDAMTNDVFLKKPSHQEGEDEYITWKDVDTSRIVVKDSKPHLPLTTRGTEPSYEERVSSFSGKRMERFEKKGSMRKEGTGMPHRPGMPEGRKSS